MLKLLWKPIDRITTTRWMLITILLINIAGSVFGFYYYWEQLMMTPVYLWLTVPDCPLYTFFMIFALLLILLKKPSDTFNVITAVGLSMYGIWTTVVLLYFGEIYFAPANALMSAGLWISHLGMALEGFLLIPFLARAKPVAWAVTALWFAFLDTWDYFYRFPYDGVFIRTHPLATLEYHMLKGNYHGYLVEKVDSLLFITYGLTILFFVAMILLAKAYAKDHKLKNVIEEKIRN